MSHAEENRRVEEMLLLSAWAEEESRREDPGGGADPPVEIPEAVLGLLDGTAGAEEAERARALLASDARLAVEYGRLAASLRELPERVPAAEPPEALRQAALGRIPGVRTDRPSAPAWSAVLEWVRALWCGPRVPVFAAMAATALLVTFVVLDSDRSDSGTVVFRSSDSSPRVVTRIKPASGLRVEGDVRFVWQALDEATAYRLVLVSPTDGEILELGPTADTSLVAKADQLASPFRARGEQDLLWTIRARLVDGTEASSSPGALHWTRSSD